MPATTHKRRTATKEIVIKAKRAKTIHLAHRSPERLQFQVCHAPNDVSHDKYRACLQKAFTVYDMTKRHNLTCQRHVRYQLGEEGQFDVAFDVAQLRRKLDFRLPMSLTREYWRRHRCSLEDIQWILDCSASVFVWHCAMLANVSVSNAAVKDTSATADSVNYGGKAIAIQKLLSIVSNDYLSEMDTGRSVMYLPTPTGNVTSMQLEETYLPVPFQEVNAHDYSMFKEQYQIAWKYGVDHEIEWMGQPRLCFVHVHEWTQAGILVVPLRLVVSTPPCMFMGQIVPFTWYQKWYDSRPCLSNMPDVVNVGGEPWIVIETFYIYTPLPSRSNDMDKKCMDEKG